MPLKGINDVICYQKVLGFSEETPCIFMYAFLNKNSASFNCITRSAEDLMLKHTL